MDAPHIEEPDIEVVERIGCPAQSAWDLIGTFGGLARWHPLVTGCTVEGEGIGSVRRVTLGDWFAVERLEQRDPATRMLTYRMMDCTRAMLVGVYGRMQIEPEGPDACLFTWQSWLPDPAPDGLAEFLAAYYPQRIGHLRAALAAS